MTSARELPPADPALILAEARCRAAGLPWTADCGRVMASLLRAPGPAKAYSVMEELRVGGRPVYPPTVYRALTVLERVGLVHRIASLSAFAPCRGGDDGHTAAFMICDGCGAVEEAALHFDHGALAPAGGGFQVRHVVVELRGLCRTCAGVQPG